MFSYSGTCLEVLSLIGAFEKCVNSFMAGVSGTGRTLGVTNSKWAAMAKMTHILLKLLMIIMAHRSNNGLRIELENYIDSGNRSSLIMNKFLLGLFGALFGLQAHASGEELIAVQDLKAQSIDPVSVSFAFQEKFGVSLTNNDILKVSYEKEGGNLRFDTLDNLSVVVPILEARGSENKTEPGN